MGSRYLHAYMHILPRDLWRLCHSILFHCFFPTNIYHGDVSVLQAKSQETKQKETMYTLTSPSLCYSLDHINEGSNKQSFEESPPLHFVLVSLVARGQNCPLQK